MKSGIIFLLLLFLFPFGAEAVSPSSISVDVSPENPAPNEEVTITLSSYAANLDSVPISWQVDGKAATAGVGKKSFTAQAPGAGQERRISATVALPDGAIEKVVVLRPAVMALLWQANDSYAPPFYKGKALPTPDSEVKVVALPEVKGVSPKNLVYDWKQDYTNNQGASGYGKNFYIYTNDYLEDVNNVSVTAATTDQKYSAGANLNINTYQPKILFYKNDPVLGTLWEEALPNGHRIADEEILLAAPYYISPKDIRIPSLVWDWSINGTYVGVSGLAKNILPLKVEPGVSGTSQVKLEISNKYKLFMSANREISVEF